MEDMASSVPGLLAAMSQIPLCVQTSTLQNIAKSGCKDIKCLCQDDNLLTSLTYDLLRKCEPTDQNRGIEVAQKLCLSALPWLNDDRGAEIVALVGVMMALSTVAVILRLIGRRISAAPYGVDDILIIVALVLTYGLNINEIIAVHYGFGRHQLMLSLDHIKKFLLNDWTIQIIFACSISVTRLSLLVFYHRLFPVKRFTIIALVTGCILIAWWISFLFAIIFSCVPVASYWNKAIVGHCINEHTLSWGITGSELAVNIIMLILPIPWLWHLRLAWTKKLALIGIFLLGCFVCVSCIVRFPLLAAVIQTDASWTIVPAGVWIVVESNIGIASVCLPLMRPLISVEFSSLSSYLPFSRSRRSGSPFTDDLENSKNSSGMPPVGEKPYDGFCPDPKYSRGQSRHYLDDQHALRDICGGRGFRDVRTHRSRIESYSPENLDPPMATPDTKRNSILNPLKAHPPLSRDSAADSMTANPPSNRNSTFDHLAAKSAMKRNLTNYPRKKEPPSQRDPILNPLTGNAPAKRISSPNPLALNPPPPRSNRNSTRKSHHHATLSKQHTASTSHTHPAATKTHRPASIHKSRPKPPTSHYTTHKTRPRSRRKTYRFSQDEMNERWRMWYQGRGSEVGKGLWSLELVPSSVSGSGSGDSGDGRKTAWAMGKGWESDGVPWEVGEEGRGKRESESVVRGGVEMPKSRL
ncbi:MAG: hypothetical protein LQ352_001053 [Teloschistes flavicans]|nr:MAG: hypothetical protein LQ352_001053 [Teloschistes flavicans]